MNAESMPQAVRVPCPSTSIGYGKSDCSGPTRSVGKLIVAPLVSEVTEDAEDLKE
jgi:hypothetical protein